MTIFFNYNILSKETGNDPRYIIYAIDSMCKGITIPKHKNSKFKPVKGLELGKSFLLNPKDLLKDKTSDVTHKAQYIFLASRRSYLDYKLYNITYLDLDMFPDFNEKAIKFNSLLLKEHNKLYFKFEEMQNGTKIW